MEIRNYFDKSVSEEIIGRINKLTPATQPVWGKMTVDQMLAHCCVSYEMVYEDKHQKPAGFKKLVLKMFVKNIVVGPKPYKKNSPTAPQFKMVDKKDFEKEKQRLIEYIRRSVADGERYFEGRESHSFGPLTANQWNAMFYKHLDHHLQQFGV
jgi:hypothetical protein